MEEIKDSAGHSNLLTVTQPVGVNTGFRIWSGLMAGLAYCSMEPAGGGRGPEVATRHQLLQQLHGQLETRARSRTKLEKGTALGDISDPGWTLFSLGILFIFGCMVWHAGS